MLIAVPPHYCVVFLQHLDWQAKKVSFCCDSVGIQSTVHTSIAVTAVCLSVNNIFDYLMIFVQICILLSIRNFALLSQITLFNCIVSVSLECERMTKCEPV